MRASNSRRRVVVLGRARYHASPPPGLAFVQCVWPHAPKRSSGPLTLCLYTCCTSRAAEVLLLYYYYSVVAECRARSRCTPRRRRRWAGRPGGEEPRRADLHSRKRAAAVAATATTIRVSVVLFLPDPCAAHGPRARHGRAHPDPPPPAATPLRVVYAAV